LACFLLYGGACGDDEHDDDPGNAELADVVYEGTATDEALEAMQALTPKTGEKKAKITTPAAGAKVADAPTFEWNFAAAAFAPQTVPRRLGMPTRLPFGMPLANAHGTPMNGNGYFLVISSPSDPKLVRVFTTQTTYKPDATKWDKIKKAGGTITAVVTTGLFDNNKVISSGGPFIGDSITFDVSP
jgi:hypothetical protein